MESMFLCGTMFSFNTPPFFTTYSDKNQSTLEMFAIHHIARIEIGNSTRISQIQWSNKKMYTIHEVPFVYYGHNRLQHQ